MGRSKVLSILISGLTAGLVAGLFVAPAAARAQVEVLGGRTSVVLDTATLEAAAGLVLSSVSPEVESPGSLPGSVAFPINARDASAPLLPTSFTYDPNDFLGSFAGTIEHDGSVLFNADVIEVGNFTIGFDPARAGTLGGEASGFFVESTTGIAAILFDLRNPSLLDPAASTLTIGADLLVSPEFADVLEDAGLAGADVGDAQVDALALVEIAGGRTSVVLDTVTLETAAGLALSSVSEGVLDPGDAPDSVAFPIEPRDAASPALPTTFAFDPRDFLGSFSGTIEHTGSVFFNADSTEVGDFTIGFDAARAGTLGGEASGFFVESTTGISEILFDVRNPSRLDATSAGLQVEADLLVSPELATLLQTLELASSDLSGADVGDAIVNAFPPTQVEITGGRTSVALDTATLESAAGLELAGVSSEVIVPSSLPDSVAFPINGPDVSLPALGTSFAFDATDFLGTFSGSIEHAGSVFFAGTPQTEVGNFTIGFDAARAGSLGGAASGFFVESSVGVAAVLFDVGAPRRLVPDPGGVEIEADLLVSPEFADFLGDAALAGADVGDARVEAVPEAGSVGLGLVALATLAALARRRAA